MKRLLLPLAMSLPAFALADPSPALDRFSLSVGAFIADPTVRASVATPYGSLDSGNLDRGHVTLPRVTGDLLFGDNQGLSFDYFRYRRDYADNFGTSTAIGPVSLTALGSGYASAKLEFGKLAYKYWLGSGDTVVGLGIGAGYYRISLNANAVAGVNGLVGNFGRSYSEDQFAPLLEVGVRHAFTPDLRLFADVSGVRKGGGGLRGHIYNAMAGVEWYPLHNVGLVLGYGATDVDLQRDEGGIDRLRIRLRGPNAFLKARF